MKEPKTGPSLKSIELVSETLGIRRNGKNTCDHVLTLIKAIEAKSVSKSWSAANVDLVDWWKSNRRFDGYHDKCMNGVVNENDTESYYSDELLWSLIHGYCRERNWFTCGPTVKNKPGRKKNGEKNQSI